MEQTSKPRSRARATISWRTSLTSSIERKRSASLPRTHVSSWTGIQRRCSVLSHGGPFARKTSCFNEQASAMTRPRVLHCIPSLAGGGAERQLAYLSRELDALGWDVHIASVHEGPSLRLFAGSGATLHLIDTSRSKYDPRLL